MDKIPASVSDVLLHNRDTDRTETVILPITRYNNVMNAPKVISDISVRLAEMSAFSCLFQMFLVHLQRILNLN